MSDKFTRITYLILLAFYIHDVNANWNHYLSLWNNLTILFSSRQNDNSSFHCRVRH